MGFYHWQFWLVTQFSSCCSISSTIHYNGTSIQERKRGYLASLPQAYFGFGKRGMGTSSAKLTRISNNLSFCLSILVSPFYKLWIRLLILLIVSYGETIYIKQFRLYPLMSLGT